MSDRAEFANVCGKESASWCDFDTPGLRVDEVFGSFGGGRSASSLDRGMMRTGFRDHRLQQTAIGVSGSTKGFWELSSPGF